MTLLWDECEISEVSVYWHIVIWDALELQPNWKE